MVRTLVSVLLALALGASVGTAQEKATELTVGVVGLSYTTCSGCDGLFVTSTGGNENRGAFSGIGGGSISVGFYLSPGVSFEPTVSLSRLSSGGESLTILGVGAAVPIYFAKGWGRKGPYFAPRVTYNSLSDGFGSSTSQIAVGAAAGTKVRLNDGAALRLQLSLAYGFEGDLEATTGFGGLVGLSVFIP